MFKKVYFILFCAFSLFLGCERQNGVHPSYELSAGFSVGGAKDVNNFRENIKEGYLPLPTDITYEGLFYDYFFDTGQTEACDKLFCPSYKSALSKDPFSKKEELFLSVGLNSGIKAEDFSRKRLNLIIVVDISGSMEDRFNSYYYDQHIKTGSSDQNSSGEISSEEQKKDLKKTKMQSASESVVALLDHLQPEDSFGVVLFNDTARLETAFTKVKEANMENIKQHILNLKPGGGTDLSAGMQMAKMLFEDHPKGNPSEVENRIIFLTDAQPNRGLESEEDFFNILKSNATQKIYTSFVGIGVDFNTELVEAINKVRGANYYAVHSPSEFKKRLDEEFDFMVTPLVFDLELRVEAPGFKIKKVYGSPEANEATGELMKVATLFPSKRTEEGTRGGIVLLHLERIPRTGPQTLLPPELQDQKLSLSISYKDRNEKPGSHSVKFAFEKKEESYDTTGIRKGILLVRYANLITNWIQHERSTHTETETNENSVKSLYEKEGIFISSDETDTLGQWERQSIELFVSTEYKKLFTDFLSYFETEKEKLGDASLDQEIEILKILRDYKKQASE